jgi:4a-hydroxytetrahydrobiopterin dehydratase
MTVLNGAQIAEEKLDGWVYVPGHLQTRIHTGDFATGLKIVNAIGEVAERMDHHPDLTLRYQEVDVRLSSHDSHGVTQRDIRLARAISSIASGAGVRQESASVSRLEWALDTPAYRSVLPFWAAILAMESLPDRSDIVDPADAHPAVWFQESGREEPRQRWHPDVWLEPEQVQPRIDAALAAGGTLVSDDEAPAFWVLADPEGNRVCLCTWQDRRG